MVTALGRQVIASLTCVGDCVSLLAQAVGHVLRGQISLRRTAHQMATAGADSFPIVVVTLFTVGMAWGWHTAIYMVRFGATGYFGGSTAVAIARELGPALCGVVFAARVGAAFAAELGTMTVTEQIDALRALAVNPVRYLVVPRLLACAIMLPLLTIIADAAGLLGAYVLSVHFGISAGEYLASMQRWLTPINIYGGVIKAFCFGIIVAIVGCRQGLSATRGAAGVGRATIGAVVLSIVLIYVANLFLTAAIFRH